MCIHVGELAEKLDKSLSDWTPRTLHRTFVEQGCAVVRNAIPANRLDDVKAATVIAFQGRKEWLDTRRAKARAQDPHVYDQDIRRVTDGNLSGFELVDVPLLKDFLSYVYEGQNWREHSVAARRIQGTELDEEYQKPLELHLDCQIHGFNFTVNFWIPFEECGVDAPSLQLVPIGSQATRKFSGYNSTKFREAVCYYGHFPKEALNIDAIVKAFGPNCFFHPIMRPGDVIVSSNWIIHGSYRTPQMRSGRTSVEVRFIGDQLEHAAAARDQFCAERDAAIAARDAAIAARDQFCAERDAAIAARDQFCAERDAAIAAVDAIKASSSWRITGPIRRVAGAIRSLE